APQDDTATWSPLGAPLSKFEIELLLADGPYVIGAANGVESALNVMDEAMRQYPTGRIRVRSGATIFAERTPPPTPDAHVTCMPYSVLPLGEAARPPVAAVIIEAPSMPQARLTAVARRLAPGVPFGEGLHLTDETVMAIPPDKIGRMMSGVEAAE